LTISDSLAILPNIKAVTVSIRNKIEFFPFPGVTRVERKPEHFQSKAFILKALAHPTRLFIVDELSRRERCVCELTDMVGADMSTVSKHLSVLKNAGIVQDEKRGLQVFYTLRLPCVLNFLRCCEAVVNSSSSEEVNKGE
jgi:ArsR family transcriptional regulator